MAHGIRGDREHRPVPQVEPVGPVADVPHRRATEEPPHPSGGPLVPDAGGDDQRGADRRQQRRRARERRRRREQHRGQPDGQHARPPEERAGSVREAKESSGSDGQRRAQAQLPRSGQSGEVGADRRPVRVVDRPGQRSEAGQNDHQREPAGVGPRRRTRIARRHGTPAMPAGAPATPAVDHDPGQHERQDERPHEVELLFDGQRPVVLDRRGGLPPREVIDATVGELDIGGKERGPDAVQHRLLGPHEVQQVIRGEVGHDQCERGRGQDSLGSPGVELA